MTRRSLHHAPTSSLRFVVRAIYIALLILFAWQTIEFVQWLFPDEQLIYKVLVFVCFDVMAFVWAMVDLFYHFADQDGARTIVRWGWAVTFILSLGASILYLSIQGYYRFHLPITADMLNIGYTVSIVALVFNILILTGFLYKEETAIARLRESHERYEERKNRVMGITHNVTHNEMAKLAQNSSVNHNAHNVTPLRSAAAVRQQRYRDRQAAKRGRFIQ